MDDHIEPIAGVGSVKVRVFEIQVEDLIPEKALKEIRVIFDQEGGDLWHMEFRPLPVFYKKVGDNEKDDTLKRHHCKIRVKEEVKGRVIEVLIRYGIPYEILGYWEWHNNEIKQ